MTREDRTNAAVSETLGYILLFAIVTLSMGVIYAIGYPALQSNMDANVFESAEQNFIVLQSNMERVAFDQTPVKVLKLKLQASSIAVTNESSISVAYDGNHMEPYPTGEIVFSKDEKTIAYEIGSVFKKYPSEASVMVSEPPIYVTSLDNTNVTNIGIVSLNGNSQMGGKGIATINLRHNSSNMSMSNSTTNVSVLINSTHAFKWEEYLGEMGFTVDNVTESSVNAHINNTMLIMSNHVVDVDIS
ncbi:hypothetical protein MettiDRAFT_1733 [Methanolobus tindarius DSM 2278]|uniref:Archaeal flagellin-like protein n=1 Tax=Methanolobus tindarius DSM 2278 TaxID=1090322 RepID=W9DRS2_METTI|nr:hypothetical protein [Methanolobus tindarius]ETA68275.1 hypothetical protein MettiDRAFT_1733 [Methanolobus tindarius DSM 2278]